jgi:tetratricopeptide (TPR) repeat protein
VAIDREETLKKAEKLLRQGRLDAAIAEYQRVVDEYPRDWNTSNTLGDCFYRAHQVDRAVEQYNRIADHFAQEGFFPKAAALYKKSLKIKPDDEHALQRAADIAIRQGTLAEAKQYLAALAERRRLLGDAHGAADVLLKLGALDPDDLEARLSAARAVAAAGDAARVAGEFRTIAEALSERNQPERALDVLVEASRVLPGDAAIRTALVARYAARGEFDAAREFATAPSEFLALADALDARGRRAEALEMVERAQSIAPAERAIAERLVRGHVALGAPERARAYLDALGEIGESDLLRIAAELRADAGQLDASRGLFARLLAREPHLALDVAQRGAALAAASAEAALVHVESAAETLLLHGDFAGAAGAYEAYLRHQPHHVAASLRLVEICVDGELAALVSAQAALTDAYLAAGRGAEARAVAEDLVASHPADAAHVDRLRQALVLTGEPDVDAAIAERLAAAGSMEATEDLGSDLSDEPEPAATAAKEADPSSTHAPGTDPNARPAPVDAPPGDAAAPPRAARSASRDPFGLGPIAIDLGDILGEELEPAADGSDPEAAEIDLSDALAGLKGVPAGAKLPPERSAPETLEAVFGDFREEVARQTRADAAEQHYKVGLTYEEMGMVPEAMKELEIAVRAPRLRFEAASRLARLALKRGTPLEAIEWFERAAEAPAPTADAGRMLLYELGDTLEAGGEAARALAVFLELQADAGEFRDVARRVERLTRAQAGG